MLYEKSNWKIIHKNIWISQSILKINNQPKKASEMMEMQKLPNISSKSAESENALQRCINRS